MYVNKCIKCGREFETKNPKRVICPDCLYPDKKMMLSPSSDSPSSVQEPVSPSFADNDYEDKMNLDIPSFLRRR